VEFLGIGLPELFVILVLALIVVGPNRLPEVAAQLARFIRAARRYGDAVTKDFNDALHDLEQEYDDMKGEWKEVGKGLDNTAKSVTSELKAADAGVRTALNDAVPAEEAPESKTPKPSPN
jgi:Tat protein translocase TatB subunit